MKVAPSMFRTKERRGRDSATSTHAQKELHLQAPPTMSKITTMRNSGCNIWLLSLWLLISPPLTLGNGSTDSRCGVTFVFFGSTGSLAKLYLWPALFKQQSLSFSGPEHSQYRVVIFGVSRKPLTNEEETWKDITSNVNCGDKEKCAERLSNFRKVTHFIQIRSGEDDYTALQTQIREFYSASDLKEVGRVFYLAIPPLGYLDVTRNIHLYGRPSKKETWLRVVLEKPFGCDLASAKLLSSDIAKYLKEEEIYRVDHYLGKFGVEQILPFRRANSAWLSPLWNKDNIQYVEIAMKERVDVKGRSKFYDSYGVIRDVQQNHLTEILIRLLVPPSHGGNSLTSEQFIAAKKSILSKLYPPLLRHSLLGQYVDYQKHLQEDGALVNDGNSSMSLTPTFVSVAMYVRDPQWHRMPFILVSGKQLDERTAYARIVFKQRQFHMGHKLSKCLHCLPEIIFLIQDEQLPSAGILISEQLSSIRLSYPTMKSMMEESIAYPRTAGCKYVYLHPSQAIEANAYVSVIQAVLEGSQEYFVDTDSLLLSWGVWSPLLRQIELSKRSLDLRPYSPDMLDGLDFELNGASMLSRGDISTVHTNSGEATSEIRASASNNASTYWTELLGHRTIVADRYELPYLVGEDLLRAAQKSVKERGEFHVALSGGQSPLSLMNVLSLDFYNFFPWQRMHVWQTDERCVKATSADSNWNQISNYLLSVIPIPFHNLHPMPVDLQNGICNSTDNGNLLYRRTLDDFIEDGRLDYIVLGVGTDGHIASIFPEATTIATSDSDDFVIVTELKDSYNVRVKKRMSLSFDVISRARSIAVVVVGAGKMALMDRVTECLRLEDFCDLPLARLISSPSVGQLAVYMN